MKLPFLARVTGIYAIEDSVLRGRFAEGYAERRLYRSDPSLRDRWQRSEIIVPCEREFRSRRGLFPREVVEPALSQFTVKDTRFILEVFHLCVVPNKTPEPTTTAVTPRALAPISEMKLPTDIPLAARGAPAVVVAHL